MFTGIIEQVGLIAGVIRTSHSARVAVSAPKIFEDGKIGDSISINGVCLTIVHLRRNFAEFDLSAETLKKTSLGDIKIGDRVNLERALLVNGRLGGHMVTGHIDGLAEIRNKVVAGDGFDLYLSIPSETLRYLVPQGSLAVDGVSLTVADFIDGLLRVAVIPQTAKSTTLGETRIGSRVNIEVDILSKYIERHLHGEPKGISDEMMTRVGFLPMGWIDN